jgi:hypothetical protein
MNKMKENQVILHGECMVTPAQIPANAKPVEVKGAYKIVADSETTGNHHVVDMFKGVSFFEDSDGGLFMKNEVPTNIRCVHENRHDSIEIPVGEYVFSSQLEYDYFTESLRNVRD